jgi:hypothetical protein
LIIVSQKRASLKPKAWLKWKAGGGKSLQVYRFIPSTFHLPPSTFPFLPAWPESLKSSQG